MVVVAYELLIVIEGMGAHVQVANARIVGQHEWQRRRLVAPMALYIEQLAHGAEVRGGCVEGCDDGPLQGAGAMAVE